MDLTFEIRVIDEEIRLCYLSLLGNQAESIQSGMLDWKLKQGSSGTAQIVCAYEGGAIVGMSTNIPTRFKIGGMIGRAFQAIDSVVSPVARGKGVFTRLAHAFESAERSRADLIWGFPNANAAPIWFNKIGWVRHGYVPFLIKPLRSGYFSGRLGFSVDFSLSRLQNHNAPTCKRAEPWLDNLWSEFSSNLNCAVQRDRAYLEWRLFGAPDRTYRVAALPDNSGGALVASRLASKHGGRIGYLMEAMGGSVLKELLASEIGWLRENGAELVLAWCFPWSPNYRALRDLGFFPLPNALRPIEMHFGSKSLSARGSIGNNVENWYLSYLDSDTV